MVELIRKVDNRSVRESGAPEPVEAGGSKASFPFEVSSRGESLFRSMADVAPIMVWISDAAGDCTWFNRQWLEFTGRKLVQELGDGWTEGVHPEDLEGCLEVFTRALRRRESFEMDYRLRRHDGEYRWIRDRGTPRFAAEPARRFTGFVGGCVDIDEFREAQAALDDRLRFERMLGKLSARFIDIAPDRLDEHIERGLRQIVEFIDLDRAILFEAHDGDLEATHAWMVVDLPEVTSLRGKDFPFALDLILRGEPFLFSRLGELPPEAARERQFFRAQGVRSHLSLPLTAGGQTVGGLALATLRREQIWSEELVQQLRLPAEVFANALARRNAETRARQLGEELAHVGRVTALGELTASIAHELNQPLAAILSNAQAGRRLLAAEAPEIDQVQECLDDIAADGRRAGKVVRRLRTLLPKGEHAATTVDVNRLIEGLLPLTKGRTSAAGAVLRLDLAPDLPPVQGDAVQLRQVLLNLILNAHDAMACAPGERELGLRTVLSQDGSEIEVSVSDTGCGMKEATRQRIFEPFFTTKPEGLGIGLSISRRIVVAHGGRLEAANGKGRGAILRLTLPLSGGDG